MEDSNCSICTEPIQTFAFGDCNHPVCHLCCLRLRALYHSRACPICKTENNSVILSSNSNKLFQEFDMRSMLRDKKLSVYCDTREVYDEMMVLLRFNCPDPECDIAVNNRNQLKEHVRKTHQKVLCDVCLTHKKIFSHEHTLFTQQSLKTHKTTGDPDDPSFKGHPSCGFCNEFFYSSDELFVHCREKHEECHICRKNGIKDQYFCDYNALEIHFEKQHFMCKDAECLEKKFIVFDNHLDFKAHMASEHSRGLSKRQQKETRRLDFSDVNFTSSPSTSSTRQNTSGQNNNRDGRSKPPPGFGRLSEIPDTFRQFNSSLETMSLKSSQNNRQKLNVTRIFDDINEPKLLSLLNSDQNLQKYEKEVVPLILDALNHDPHKWIVFKTLCFNYLRSVILPEKFYDEAGNVLGYDEFKSIFQLLLNSFPTTLRSGLLRVHRDKAVKETQLPDLQPDTESSSSASRAKILVIKSSSKGSFNRFKDALSTPWGSRYTPGNQTSDAFPALPQVQPQKPVPQFKKSSKKKKETILSTNLPTNSSNRLSKPTPPPTQWNTNSSSVTAVKDTMKPTAPSVVHFPAPSHSMNKLPREEFPSLPKTQKPKSIWAPINKNGSSAYDAWNGQFETDQDFHVDSQESTSSSKKKKKVLLRFG